MGDPEEDAMVEALHRAVEASFACFERGMRAQLFARWGPWSVRHGASLATLRRRVKYGGRKGRRAARRLAGR